MQKILTYLCISIFFLFTSISLAQSLFNFGSKPTAATSPSNAAPNGQLQVLSPSDFKAKVNALSKQNQQQLVDQLTQQLAKKPTTPEPQPVPAPPPVTTQLPANASQNTPTQETQTTINPIQTPSMPAPAATVNVPTTTNDANQQGQVYTGFGQPNAPQDQGNQPANTGQQQGGGLGIKY